RRARTGVSCMGTCWVGEGNPCPYEKPPPESTLQYPLTDRSNQENQTPLPDSIDAGDSNKIFPNRSSGFALGTGVILRVLQGDWHEDQIALRGTRTYVARLVQGPVQQAPMLHLHPDAAYLITGGLWGLGLECAHWLATRGARHLVLLGRS